MNWGINGLGRIGRQVLRLSQKAGLCIKAINTPSPVEMSAHLLKHDSVHGPFPGKVCCGKGFLQLGESRLTYGSYALPSQIPWGKWGVQGVLECSGVFKTRAHLQGHFPGGAKKVLVAAPVSEADKTIIYGVNHTKYDFKNHHIISNSSCTTNALAPLMKVLEESFQIKDLMFMTTHSYTLDQKLLDSSHKKDFRRARAAALSLIPTTSGAARSLIPFFPHLKGRVTGQAVRVPTANVSLLDVVFQTQAPVTKQKLCQVFREAQNGPLKNILHCEEEELVSADFNGSPFSCVVDMPSVVAPEEEASPSRGQASLSRILAWYDNETGFSQRMLDVAKYISTQNPGEKLS